jgi:hypothetical protein
MLATPASLLPPRCFRLQYRHFAYTMSLVLYNYSQPGHPFVPSFTAEQIAYYGGPPFDCFIRGGSEGPPAKRVIVST